MNAYILAIDHITALTVAVNSTNPVHSRTIGRLWL